MIFLIACLHVYWALGGRVWSDRVIPTDETGAMLFVPGKIATFAVAAVLCILSYALISSGTVAKSISALFTFVFFVRFMGDFNYVGIFKKQKNTLFARMDTLLYSPLCLLLAICCATATFF